MASTRESQSRLLRTLKLGGALLTLAIAVAITFGVMAHVGASHNGGASAGPTNPAIHGQKGKATCDLPGQPKCPSADPHWVTVASAAPSDILTAMQSSPAYMSPTQATAAPSGSTFSFDTPVEVLNATLGNQENVYNMPHYIVRASINGVRQVSYDLTYDPAHKLLYISSIGMNLPNDAHYGKAFPWDGVTASAALSKLQSVRQMSAAPGFQPELVYFAPDPSIAQPGQTHPWAGGGTSAAEPIWRIKGADGHAYFVGIDGNVYTDTQLPIEHGAAMAQM